MANLVVFGRCAAFWPCGQLFSAVLLGLVIAWLAISTLRQYRRLSHFPGPASAHLSKWWLIRATATGEMPFRLAALTRQWGSLARIGPNDLVTDDADVLRQINGLRSPFVRSDWYNATAFSHEVNHVFCERDDERHADRRMQLIPAYSGKGIEGLESTMDSCIEALCALIEGKYLSDAWGFRPVDLARICSYFTLEVIHKLAFGTTLGFLEHDCDMYGYLDNQSAMLPVFEWLSTLPTLEKFLRQRWISRNVMPKKTDRTGVGLLLNFAEKAVRERRVQKHGDMLASFIEHGLSDQEAEQEAVLQVIAGADTTATSIRMTLFLIMTNSGVYHRLLSELDAAEQRDGMSSPISDAEARRLPYLGACIKEGLRMWPPVVGLMSKVVPHPGVEIKGNFVPGGTCIGYCAWALQRKEQTFGADANVFRPERWLVGDKDEDALAEMERVLDLVFGHGKNACLGKQIAQMEMKKTVAELLRRFDLSIVQPEKPFESVNRNGLFIQKNMFVRFSRRGQSRVHR